MGPARPVSVVKLSVAAENLRSVLLSEAQSVGGSIVRFAGVDSLWLLGQEPQDGLDEFVVRWHRYQIIGPISGISGKVGRRGGSELPRLLRQATSDFSNSGIFPRRERVQW